MNKVEAIIRPEMLNSVKDALSEAGLPGINVAQVTGRGAQRGIEVGGPRGVAGSYVIDMLPKVKLETVVKDEDTQRPSTSSLRRRARATSATARFFIIPVANAIRIRTGETGEIAL